MEQRMVRHPKTSILEGKSVPEAQRDLTLRRWDHVVGAIAIGDIKEEEEVNTLTSLSSHPPIDLLLAKSN